MPTLPAAGPRPSLDDTLIQAQSAGVRARQDRAASPAPEGRRGATSDAQPYAELCRLHDALQIAFGAATPEVRARYARSGRTLPEGFRLTR